MLDFIYICRIVKTIKAFLIISIILELLINYSLKLKLPMLDF